MLNPRSIESALRNCAREVLLTDGSGERGTGRLALRVRPGGDGDGPRAEWLVLWWRDGKRRYGKLGRYPSVSLREARDLFADEWRPEIEAGRDPRRAKRIAALAGSVQDLFEGYVGAMKRKGRSSWDEVERALLTGRYAAVKSLGAETKAADVSPDHITQFLAKAFERGSRTAADRYRAYLHAAFQWGAGSTYDYTSGAATGADGLERPQVLFGIKVNPVTIVPRDGEANKARTRALSIDEVRALWNALDGVGFGLSTAPAIRLLLCTGQRVTDVLRAEGCDFNLRDGVWIIPAAKRKNTRTRKKKLPDHLVVLTPEATTVVRELIKIRGNGLLFPIVKVKKRGGGKGDERPAGPEHVPDQTINRALGRWAARAKVPHFQARDLRRTWKTLGGEAKISKEDRDRVQGHALSDVSSVHYDMYEYIREKRDAMRKWSAFLNRILRQTVAPDRRAA